MTSALVALDEEVAVARVEVHYHDERTAAGATCGSCASTPTGCARRSKSGPSPRPSQLESLHGELATAFNDVQRETLDALCETFVPSVEVDTMDPVEAAFMRRSALDMHLPAQIEGMLAEAMTAEELAGDGRPAARARRAGHRRGADRGAHPDRARHVGRRPGRQARPDPAARADAAAVLRAARRARPEPQLGGRRLPGPGLGRAVGRAGAEDDRAGRGQRRAAPR